MDCNDLFKILKNKVEKVVWPASDLIKVIEFIAKLLKFPSFLCHLPPYQQLLSSCYMGNWLLYISANQASSYSLRTKSSITCFGTFCKHVKEEDWYNFNAILHLVLHLLEYYYLNFRFWVWSVGSSFRIILFSTRYIISLALLTCAALGFMVCNKWQLCLKTLFDIWK